MKCPNCQSSNIQSHVIVEDKQSRNLAISLIMLLFSIVLCLLLFGNDYTKFLSFGAIIVIVLIILNIVLSIIPARHKVVFVCHECGTEFEKYGAK